MAQKRKRKSPARSTGNKQSFVRILSIDGGGIRGIIPGQVLVNLEKKLQSRTNDLKCRLADFFDLIAGTSTGGILTCCYLAPEAKSGTAALRPKFTAEEAVNLYLERGDDVFDANVLHRIRTLGGVRDEKYPADGLEEALQDYFGDLELKHLIKPCLITAYDIKRRMTMFFNKRDAETKPSYNFYVREIARATSAAPTFFEVARIKSMTNITYPLVDGGLFANNPALCAYAEARDLPRTPTAIEMAILSLGTGTINKPYEYRIAKDWGLVDWVKPVLDIMMAGVAETVDYQLRKIFDSVGRPEQYLRIEPELGDASPDMDDASRQNLEALREAGQYAAQKNDRKLDAFVDLLVKA